MTLINLAGEGRTDISAAMSLIKLLRLKHGATSSVRSKSKIDAKLQEFNRTGRHLNWLILRDLDHDAKCASQLIKGLIENRSPRMSIRIPVRTIESWLFADADGFAGEFYVDRHRLPKYPDELNDPKQQVVEICKRSNQSKIRKAMVPRNGSGRKVGPEYDNRMSTFATNQWDPQRAAQRSPSLQRTLAALRKLVNDKVWT